MNEPDRCEETVTAFRNAQTFQDYNYILNQVWQHILYGDCLVCRVAKNEALERLNSREPEVA